MILFDDKDDIFDTYTPSRKDARTVSLEYSDFYGATGSQIVQIRGTDRFKSRWGCCCLFVFFKTMTTFFLCAYNTSTTITHNNSHIMYWYRRKARRHDTKHQTQKSNDFVLWP